MWALLAVRLECKFWHNYDLVIIIKSCAMSMVSAEKATLCHKLCEVFPG